jgi:hypothetical protein
VRCDQWRVDDISDDVASELFSFTDRIHVCLWVFVVYAFFIVYSEKVGDIKPVTAKTLGTDGARGKTGEQATEAVRSPRDVGW